MALDVETMGRTGTLETKGVATPRSTATLDWRQSLPVLRGPGLMLRELQASDASSLLAMVTTSEVTRFIWPPPTTLEGFERFIAWSHRQRREGNYVCFAVVPDGYRTAVGLFQLRTLDPGGFATAEWGFALGSEFWGTGLFLAGAELVLAFAFDTIRIHRLEARAAVRNGRGNGALRKLGAAQEGVLRRSFLRDGQYLDQVLWAILESDWRRAIEPARPPVH